MNVQDLINENLISPSIADVIFSTDEIKQRSRLKTEMLISTSYRVCEVYAALIHAYVVGKAIHLGTTVDALTYKNIAPKILDFWNTNISRKFNDMMPLSLLICAMRDGEREWFEPEAENILNKVRDIYHIYSHNTPRGNLSQKVDLHSITPDMFKALLRALPLLRRTVIEKESFKFFFSDGATKFSIKCLPFIGYWNAEKEIVLEKDTDYVNLDEEPPNECCVLVGVKKGRTEMQLRLEILVLDGLRDSKDNTLLTKIIQNSLNNEYLRMICAAVKMPIKWGPAGQSKCDLSFLKILTETVSATLTSFWSSEETYMEPGLITVESNLRKMFRGSELQNAIGRDAKIDESELVNTFYELFINYGIFKTMYALFLDLEDWSFGEKLFDAYFECLEKSTLTPGSVLEHKTECAESIADHIKKLSTVIPETSPKALHCRTRAIQAEWRAYYALKAAGLHADKLFTEQESIQSIDDYYYMIKNSSTQLTDDLRDVMTLLISFYKALLSASIPFDENKFHADMWRERRGLEECPLVDLLSLFASVVAESESNSETLQHYVGRSRICDAKKLEKFISPVRKYLKKAETELNSLNDGRRHIFISYAHDDKEAVKKYIKPWRAQNLPIYIDETDFHAGDDWTETAKAFIHSVDCKVVVAFLSEKSVISNAVSLEICAADEAANRKFADIANQGRFIIPINLCTKGSVEQYLHRRLNLDYSNGGFSPVESGAAREIARVITRSKIQRDMFDDQSRVLQEVKERLSVEFDGTLDHSQRQYSNLEYAVASLYAFLKFGDDFSGCRLEEIDDTFKNKRINGKTCVFPLVASVKETKIKRDNIMLMGYEIIGNKESDDTTTNYILSAEHLMQDDYYCLPDYRTTAKDCSWMVEPFLIRHDMFAKPPKEDLK